MKERFFFHFFNVFKLLKVFAMRKVAQISSAILHVANTTVSSFEVMKRNHIIRVIYFNVILNTNVRRSSLNKASIQLKIDFRTLTKGSYDYIRFQLTMRGSNFELFVLKTYS